jgi:single-strand DNA-binding protein
MNHCVFIGNCVRDLEVTQTSSGVSVCKFDIAVNRKFPDANGVRQVDYLTIITWRQLAENCAKFLRKGKKCCVIGALQVRDYETKNGEKRRAVEIVADEVEFLSPKEQDEQPEQGKFAPVPSGFFDKSKPRKPLSQLEPADEEDPF